MGQEDSAPVESTQKIAFDCLMKVSFRPEKTVLREGAGAEAIGPAGIIRRRTGSSKRDACEAAIGWKFLISEQTKKTN